MKSLFRSIPFLLVWGCLHGQSLQGDCANGYVLCNKDVVVLESLPGAGINPAEIPDTKCLDAPFPETNSVWLKWTIAEAGSLDFTILPLDERDDIDFVLYRLPKSLQGCEAKEELRCMLAGPELGESSDADSPCTGATGLRPGTLEITGEIGCRGDSSNFLATSQVHAGEHYALFVHNFRSSGGFMLEFAGTCVFQELALPCGTSPSPILNNFDGNFIRVSNVQPNPVVEMLNLTVETNIDARGYLYLVDNGGRVIEILPVSFLPGTHQISLNTAELSPGVYFIKIRLGNHAYLARFAKA